MAYGIDRVAAVYRMGWGIFCCCFWGFLLHPGSAHEFRQLPAQAAGAHTFVTAQKYAKSG